MIQETQQEREARVQKEVLEQLAPITSKQVEDLTEADAGVLRARRSYLTADQLATFADVLRGAEPEEAAASAPAKSSKKSAQ